MKTISVGDRMVTPTKIVCVGRNYVGHVRELKNEVPGEPVFFLKPNSSISDVLYSFHLEPLHYEGEISFLYEGGRFSAVGFGLDITKRAQQNSLKAKGLPWERAKAFDHSALFSRFSEIGKISHNLSLQLRVNGQLRQAGHIEQMIYKPDAILADLSRFMSLEDGDVVMTGTPQGVGQIASGDVFSGVIMEGDTCLASMEWTAV